MNYNARRKKEIAQRDLLHGNKANSNPQQPAREVIVKDGAGNNKRILKR